MKICNILLMLFLVNGLYAQYKPFPKLEKLYQAKKYDECINKANEEIGDNADEIYPLIWQMRCYIAIEDLQEHKLKKMAVKRALNVAKRIIKKDKTQTTLTEILPDLKKLFAQNDEKCKQMSTSQLTEILNNYNECYKILPLASILYNKYHCLQAMDAVGIERYLEEAVDLNYEQFDSKSALFEELPKAYFELVESYLINNKTSLADGTIRMYKEVHKEQGKALKESVQAVLEQNINYSISLGSLTEIAKWQSLVAHCDSMFTFSNTKILIKKCKYGAFLLVTEKKYNYTENDKKVIMDYMPYLAPNPNDSIGKIYLSNYKISNNEIYFERWIEVILLTQKNQTTSTAIKQISNYLQQKNELAASYLFLKYCNNKFPKEKALVNTLYSQVKVLITKNISHISSFDEITTIAETINTKEVRDRQHEIYTKAIKEELLKKNYPLLSRYFLEVFKVFPNDVNFLEYYKTYIIQDYKENYLRLYNIGDIGYFDKEPDIDKCYEGKVSAKGNQVALEMIAYVRRLTGLSDSIFLDEKANNKAQKAALMMQANYNLDHSPPKNWKCYTSEGAIAAGQSNLSLGHSFQHAVMGQIEDNGRDNYSCGHRRWILNPYKNSFGHGSTLSAMSLVVFGLANHGENSITYNKSNPVMWPSANYFPSDLVPNRWSFSYKGAIFDNAKVTVTENGKPISVQLEKVEYGYGMNTLVWRLDKEVTRLAKYTVTISNISDCDITKYTYNVIPIFIP